MVQQIINTGTVPNDGTGDTIKASFTKSNANFTELYAGAGSSLVVLQDYIAGLTLSNGAGDLANDVTIAPGQAADSTNSVMITLGVTLTKRLDGDWAPGTDAGGRDQSVLTDNTTYHVFLVRNPTTQVVDVVLSALVAGPSMPAGSGFTQFRRVGSIIRKANTILQFRQSGSYFYLTTIPEDLDTAALTTTRLLTSLTVPLAISPIAMIRVACSHATDASVTICDPSEPDLLPSFSAPPGVTVRGQTAAAVDMQVRTNANGQIAARSSVSATSLRYYTLGWIDSRGSGSIESGGNPAPTPIGFRAVKAVDQTGVVSITWTKVTFPTEDYDLGGYYDTTLSRWTPPAGLVHFDLSLYISAGGTANTAGYAAIYKNGVLLKSSVAFSGVATQGTQVSTDDLCDGTDYYEAYCYGSGTLTVSGNVIYTWFAGYFVQGGIKGDKGQDGATGPMGPPAPVGAIAAVGFLAHKNTVDQTALVSGADNKLTFGTEVYDSGGYYDAVNSRWFPPAGQVHLDAAFGTTTNLTINTAVVITITKNGGFPKIGASWIGGVTSVGYAQVSCNDVASGTDYYEVFARCTAAAPFTVSGTTSTTWFTGYATGGPKGDKGDTGISGAVTGYLVHPQGRLSIASGNPLPSGLGNAQTLYYSPYAGDRIPIWNGTSFDMAQFPILSCLMNDSLKNPAAVGANENHDWYVWNDAGTLRLGHDLAWTDDVTRAAGRTPQLINGIWTNNVGITNGPATNRGTYVGSTHHNASGGIDWAFGGIATGGSAALMNVWNCYNRLKISTFSGDDTNSWSGPIVANTWRAANLSGGMRTSFIRGLAEDSITATYSQVVVAGASMTAYIGIGLDSVSAFSGMTAQTSTATSLFCQARYSASPSVGYHYLQAIEANSGTTASSYRGDNALPLMTQTGMQVELMA